MNKKYILKKDTGEKVYCILDGEKNENDELEKVFGIEKGYGLTAEVFDGKVVVKNYYRGDNLASFPVIAIEDTTEETVYLLTPIEKG